MRVLLLVISGRSSDIIRGTIEWSNPYSSGFPSLQFSLILLLMQSRKHLQNSRISKWTRYLAIASYIFYTIYFMQMQSQLKIPPFALYQLDKGNTANARCCFESDVSKIICTVTGPILDNKYSGREPLLRVTVNITDSSSNNNNRSFDQIQIQAFKHILRQCLVLENYTKSALDFTFDVLQAGKDLFSEMVNLLCYSCAIAGLALRDLFAGCAIAMLESGQNKLNPHQDDKVSTLVQVVNLRKSKKVLHLNSRGGCNAGQLQKMIGMLLSCTDLISQTIQRKLASEIQAHQ